MREFGGNDLKCGEVNTCILSHDDKKYWSIPSTKLQHQLGVLEILKNRRNILDFPNIFQKGTY